MSRAKSNANQSFQFVAVMTGLHRVAFSPFRYAKAAAEL